MKFASTSIAKYLILLCIVISISAVRYGGSYHEETKETLQAIDQIRAEGSQLETNLTAFKKALQSQSNTNDVYTGRTVEANLASVMIEIMRARILFGVFYSTINVSGQQAMTARTSGGEHLDVKQLSMPLKGSGASGLKVIPLKIKGNYRDYGLVKKFFEFLHQLPIATKHVYLQGDVFEIDILVLGK